MNILLNYFWNFLVNSLLLWLRRCVLRNGFLQALQCPNELDRMQNAWSLQKRAGSTVLQNHCCGDSGHSTTPRIIYYKMLITSLKAQSTVVYSPIKHLRIYLFGSFGLGRIVLRILLAIDEINDVLYQPLPWISFPLILKQPVLCNFQMLPHSLAVLLGVPNGSIP